MCHILSEKSFFTKKTVISTTFIRNVFYYLRSFKILRKTNIVKIAYYRFFISMVNTEKDISIQGVIFNSTNQLAC